MSTDTLLEEKTKTIIKEPSKWTVIVLNDDTTPMDFVVAMLIEIFKHDEEKAVRTTLSIHESGSGVAGIYDFEIAEAKAVDGTKMARDNGFPLQIKIANQN